MKKPVIPHVDEDDLSPKSKKQVNVLQKFAEKMMTKAHELGELVARMGDELAVLKGLKKRPVFKPSGMAEKAGKTDAKTQQEDGKKPKRPGSAKRSKTASIKITAGDCIIQPEEPIPPDSCFKGYRDFVVQDIEIRLKNTRYRLARWKTPDGRTLTGKLPASLKGGHFGPELVAYMLYQHHQNNVTQPLLHEQLREFGVDISSGQVNAILLKGKNPFHVEKDAVLATGLALSQWVGVDDTGARHKGKNCFVTNIGNDHFSSFHTSATKSRINFLELLHAGQIDYLVNDDALAHMKKHKMLPMFLDALRNHEQCHFLSEEAWHAHLKALGITTPNFCKVATEGALMGSLSGLHVATDMAIISDDAGQFNVFMHALCWIHAERLVYKLLPLNKQNGIDIERIRGEIWDLYFALKIYQAKPSTMEKEKLQKQFDTIFTQWTSFSTLNLLLTRLHKNKAELLLVLDRPDIPLHTNGIERNIRGEVKTRKISGGTRSDLGLQCRNTFSSLKQTCRKLGVSFWDYLIDRISCSDQIPLLHNILEQRLSTS
jgi:hypothetical protein